jgi:hypothetical protein
VDLTAAQWRTSSYTTGSGDGASCVEVAAPWRKSSYSTGSGDGESCVEIAFLPRDTIAVRDTTDRTGPALSYPAPAWTHFLRNLA